MEYSQPVSSATLNRLTRAQQNVGALAAILTEYDDVTIPTMARELKRATDALAEARNAADRLERAIVQHAAPSLMATDAKFAEAAVALDAARRESEAERERLSETFGYDARFSAVELFHALPAGIANLVDATRNWRDGPETLADRHARAFALEN